MRSFSEVLGQKGISLQREIIKIEFCESCGNDLKVYRMQLIGGPKKGEWATITEECSCFLSQLVLQEATTKKLNYFLDRSTINQSLVHATLENYSPSNNSQINAVKNAITFIEKLTLNQSARMVYYGDPGLGKSHLAVAISKMVQNELKKTCLFIEVPKLKQLIKSSWSKESEYTELEMMMAIADVDLLILDDVGAEGITAWTKELLFSILNSRLCKNLLVTTNLMPSEFYQEYGLKITDRLFQGISKQAMVKIEGKHSYRLKELFEDER